MTLKQISTLIALLAIPSSVLSMNLVQERLTTWPEQVYHNAYQGAQQYYSFGKEEYTRAVACAMTATKEQANKEQWSEEFRVVCDWIYALKKTEEAYLSQPYKSWSLEDVKTISSWLTRLTIDEPGIFREDPAYWEIRTLSNEERAFARLIMNKEHLHYIATHQDISTTESNVKWQRLLAVAIPFVKEALIDKCTADVKRLIYQKGIPIYLSEPISEDEKTFLKAAFILFTMPEYIEYELSRHLTCHNEYMGRLGVVEHGEEQKKVVSKLGAIFHYELVRVHPFTEGSKRLGRLCMNIMRMQHGIEPITIANATDYRRSLMISLIREDSDPFIDYLMNIKSSPEQPQQEIAKKCAQCKKENATQRCGRCKKVNYCDRECQKLHWKSHKEICKT